MAGTSDCGVSEMIGPMGNSARRLPISVPAWSIRPESSLFPLNWLETLDYPALVILCCILGVLIGLASQGRPAPAVSPFIETATASLSFALLPLSTGMALLRDNPRDAKIVVDRSLLFSMLAALLGGVLVGGFLDLREVFQFVIGSSQTGTVIGLSAAGVALFGPARREVQRSSDWTLHGVELDHEKTLTEYSSRKRAIRRAPDTDTYGRYVKTGILGQGGMGEVYRGYDPQTQRPVAIKVMTASQSFHERAHQRFLREAQALEQLEHPHIVRLLQFGEKGGIPFMVMEYIDGENLHAYFDERGHLPLSELLPLIQDLASALDYAHGKGIIHRDIKPSNVVLEPASGRMRPVLMDFGVAKLMDAAVELTGNGMVGTLDYISPEQIQGGKGIDGRADVYSLGAMTYQLLTGELPFKHANPGVLLMAHMTQPPPDPRDQMPDVPDQVAFAIMKAMEKRPEDRFATAGDFARAMVAELVAN